jgi:probable phosphoglycerate mutase
MNALSGTENRRRIYLMRHGHVDYFAPAVVASGDTNNVELTERGRREADAAAHAFAHVALDRAICSGLPRTLQTAQIVLSRLPEPPFLEVEPAFVEIRGGRANVASREELAAIMTHHMSRASEDDAQMLDGGEAFLAAQLRALEAIRKLLGAQGWRQILIVAHEGINRLILSWASGAGLVATSAFEQDTACINVIDFDVTPAEGGLADPEAIRVMIKALNLTPYNYLKHGMNLTSLESIFARDEAST